MVGLSGMIGEYLFKIDFLLQLIVSLVVLVVLRLYLFARARQRRYKLFHHYGIPTPPLDLTSGNYNESAARDRHLTFDQHYQRKFGRVFGHFMGDEPGITVVDLELLKAIFLEQPRLFRERTDNFMASPVVESVLYAPYHRWKPMRKAMSPWFSGHQVRGQQSVRFLEESVQLMLDYVERKFQESSSTTTTNNDGQECHKSLVQLDIQDLLKATSLHTISSMAIKLDNVQVQEHEPHVESLDEFLRHSDRGPLEWAIRFPFIKPILSFIVSNFEYNRQMATIYRNLNNLIDEGLQRLKLQQQQQHNSSSLLKRDEDGDSEIVSKVNGNQVHEKSLIDTLIKMHHEGKMTREEAISNANAILFAGFDTTSTTLTYVFWALAKHQEVQDRLRRDLVTYGNQSVYMEQVMNETMRMFPTVLDFVTRIASETVQIDGLTIPKGTKVYYKSWLIFRNPAFWPEPDRFDPDRFKPGKEIHPCAFAPFGFGERKCLGYQLAKLEMKMIICDMLLRYKITLITPDELGILNHAAFLSKPKQRVIIGLEKLTNL